MVNVPRAPYQRFVEKCAKELVASTKPWDTLRRSRIQELQILDAYEAHAHLARAYATLLHQLFEEMVDVAGVGEAFSKPGFSLDSQTPVMDVQKARLAAQAVLDANLPDYEERFKRLLDDARDEIVLL